MTLTFTVRRLLKVDHLLLYSGSLPPWESGAGRRVRGTNQSPERSTGTMGRLHAQLVGHTDKHLTLSFQMQEKYDF